MPVGTEVIRLFESFPRENHGEAGIRTLGTLLGYNALAKRRFRPLSHLTWDLRWEGYIHETSAVKRNLGYDILNRRKQRVTVLVIGPLFG